MKKEELSAIESVTIGKRVVPPLGPVVGGEVLEVEDGVGAEVEEEEVVDQGEEQREGTSSTNFPKLWSECNVEKCKTNVKNDKMRKKPRKEIKIN